MKVLLSTNWIDRKIFGLKPRVWIPLAVLILICIGILTPLFDLNHVHGVGSPKTYFQHFYFDFVSGLGGYWAATFCSHWYHKIPLFIAIDVLTTFALVTLIG